MRRNNSYGLKKLFNQQNQPKTFKQRQVELSQSIQDSKQKISIPQLNDHYNNFHIKILSNYFSNQNNNQKQQTQSTDDFTMNLSHLYKSQKNLQKSTQPSFNQNNQIPERNFHTNKSKTSRKYMNSYKKQLKPHMIQVNSQKIQKESSLSSTTIKHKLPLTILEFIIKQAKQHQTSYTSEKTKSGEMLGKLGLSKKLAKKYNTQICQICQCQNPIQNFQKMSAACEHNYCSSCLHQYVLYKINAFESVQCPNQECRELIDQQSNFYKELPLQARKKYKKLLQYEMIKTHPNRKMCPQEKCQGWIEIDDNIDPVCNICDKKFCPKCLLKAHEGDCDNQQLIFFQDTLHYRQCNKCKNVIQKSSGCIHMTCKCGYQFCYLCGAKWKHSHTCNNPDNQPIIIEPIDCGCCEVRCDCDCDYCDQCCDSCEIICEICSQDCDNCCLTCCDSLEQFCCCCNQACQCCECCENSCCQACYQGCCFIIVASFWYLFVISFYLIGMFIFGIFWFVLCVLIGMTFYTCQYIGNLREESFYYFFAAILAYPFTMFIGIKMSLGQLFIEEFIENFRQTFIQLIGFPSTVFQ